MNSMLTALILFLFSTVLSPNAAQAAWWRSAFKCDNGAAAIDVDLAGRRNVQLVIRNPGIIKYFNESGSLTGTSWLVWDGRLHNLTNNANETVVPGELRNGIFHSSQFSGFTSPVSYADRQFYVYREGKGLKLRIVIPWHYAYCNGGVDSGGGCIDLVPERQEREVANWFFQDCKEEELPQ